MNDALKDALRTREVAFSELSNGDVFFRRAYDSQSMYIRQHADGTYDWSQNAARNDTNLMDFRDPARHDLAEALRRVDDFLGVVVSGRIVIDTLGMVRRSMALGMGRENAEKIAMIARDFALEMHNSGMDAEEIRSRFEEIHEQLRQEHPGHVTPQKSAEATRTIGQ